MDATRIQIIARIARRYVSGASKRSGVSTAEYDSLHIIRKHEGINQEQIAEALNIDKSAVTRMIQNLERKGYVIRQKDKRDKRRNRIYATEKARGMRLEKASSESLFYEWLTESIEPEEQEIFFRVLERLAQKALGELDQGFVNLSSWESGK
ncbi:MAG: MarR family transcriptional regulator [Eubacteriaceae bacterium]|nr:MarR family transcriptional regulator [Eubacteriaceae bacterium]